MTKKQAGIRFMKHYVTDGTIKVRVSYSNYVSAHTGQPIVALYAKEYGSELYKLLPGLYENHTDLQTDYFEKGTARIPEGHQLYAAALERAKANEADSVARYQARRAKEDAKAAPARATMPAPAPKSAEPVTEKRMPEPLRDRYIQQLDDAIDHALEQTPKVFLQDSTITRVSFALSNASRLQLQFPTEHHGPLTVAVAAGRSVTKLFDTFRRNPDDPELGLNMKWLRTAISSRRAAIKLECQEAPKRVAPDSTTRYLLDMLPTPGAKVHFTGYEKQDRMEGVCLTVVDGVAIVLMSNGMVETCKRIEDEPSKSGWHAGPLRPQSA